MPLNKPEQDLKLTADYTMGPFNCLPSPSWIRYTALVEP